MRKLILFAAVLAICAGFSQTSFARSSSHTGSHHVSSYTRHNGTTVRAHERTNPNRSRLDNWSTKGNVNPRTGKAGTVDPNRPRR